MTIEELKVLFKNEFLSESRLYSKDSSFVNGPQSSPSYQFYPIKAISKLQHNVIEVIYKRLGEPLDEYEHQEKNNELLARFTVGADYKLLFAKEGTLSRTTPAHSDMTEVCYTAGNVRFSATDFETVTEISNKSGHFKPSFSSLLWIIAVLYANQEDFKFGPVIKLCHVSISAEEDFEISITNEELFDLLPTALKENEDLMDAFIANNQSEDIVQVGQDNKRKNFPGFFHPSPEHPVGASKVSRGRSLFE